MNSGHTGVSVARMLSPEGWEEPGQRPEFEEITVVLQRPAAGRARRRRRSTCGPVRRWSPRPGEWVRYSSPEPGGAEYVAICLPAFSPATVHRDA